ncbi:MAG: hypothetical protein JWO73_31 [Candidatus Taylorbacteria bacterium]|nr:hypothetical protein [Candidatus Taylorbacteria bacterium]
MKSIPSIAFAITLLLATTELIGTAQAQEVPGSYTASVASVSKELKEHVVTGIVLDFDQGKMSMQYDDNGVLAHVHGVFHHKGFDASWPPGANEPALEHEKDWKLFGQKLQIRFENMSEGTTVESMPYTVAGYRKIADPDPEKSFFGIILRRSGDKTDKIISKGQWCGEIPEIGQNVILGHEKSPDKYFRMQKDDAGKYIPPMLGMLSKAE